MPAVPGGSVDLSDLTIHQKVTPAEAGTPVPEVTFTYDVVPLENEDGKTGPALTPVDITGNGEGALPAGVFDAPGTYRYAITQRASENSAFSHDDTTFYLFVYVGKNQDGSLYRRNLLVTTDKENADPNAKVSEVVFENTYTSPEKPENPLMGYRNKLTPFLVAGGLAITVFIAYVFDRRRKNKKFLGKDI